jgi:hypothetical protein
MATNNALDNASAPFTVTSGGLTVSTGSITLTPLSSTPASGIITISNAGILGEVDTGAAGTILVGTAASPKFLAAGTSTYVLQTNGAGSDPTWVVNSGGGPITGQTQYAVEVGASGGGIQSLSVVGPTGSCLMGNTGANPSWTGSPIFSGTVTITGAFSAQSFAFTYPANPASPIITIGGDSFLNVWHQGSLDSENIFLGSLAGNPSAGANVNQNIGIGYQALSSLTGAISGQSNGNVGIGSQVLESCTSGSQNCACGFQSSMSLTTSKGNCSYGYQSLAQIISGSFNSCLGALSGYNYTGSEGSNICIGYNVGGTPGESNTLRIGAGTGTGDGQLNSAYIAGIYGKSVSGSAVYVSASDQLGVLVSSARYKENIQDMADDSSKLIDLRPVTFNYKSDSDKNAQYGLIAEEVGQIYPELVSYDKDGKPFTVHYHLLPAMLLNEFQKLSAEMKILEAQLAEKGLS